MAYDYDPEAVSNCWEKATYEAELLATKDTTSKKTGNPMEVWTFRVFHPDGRTQQIDEYVVFPSALWKVKQFAVAIGREAEFKAGRFHAEQYLRANVRVELIVEEGTGQFEAKNKIGKFVPEAVSPPQAPATPPARPAPQQQRQPAAVEPPGSTTLPPVRPRQPQQRTVVGAAAPAEGEQFQEADIPF